MRKQAAAGDDERRARSAAGFSAVGVNRLRMYVRRVCQRAIDAMRVTECACTTTMTTTPASVGTRSESRTRLEDPGYDDA